MNKEEFEKAFKILESHFSGKYQESEEVVNAYKLWKSDYIKETMENFENKKTIHRAIELIYSILKNPEAYSGKDNAGNLLKILQGEEEK